MALVAYIGGNALRWTRNRSGRVHFYWVNKCGEASEFYTPGASRRTYFQNALTLGCIKRCPSMDEVPRKMVAR